VVSFLLVFSPKPYKHYSLPYALRIIKARRMGWARLVAGMGMKDR
jgi:hypothetical protein